MPFVIGVMGVGGKSAGEDHLKFREAMTAPALLPEFQGNIFAVPMSPFWDEPLAAIQPRNGNRSSTFHRHTPLTGHLDATPRSRRLERQVEA
jgi:hypothetical protein